MNNKDHLVWQLTINNNVVVNELKLLMKLFGILLCIDLFHRIMEIMSATMVTPTQCKIDGCFQKRVGFSNSINTNSVQIL